MFQDMLAFGGGNRLSGQGCQELQMFHGIHRIEQGGVIRHDADMLFHPFVRTFHAGNRKAAAAPVYVQVEKEKDSLNALPNLD